VLKRLLKSEGHFRCGIQVMRNHSLEDEGEQLVGEGASIISPAVVDLTSSLLISYDLSIFSYISTPTRRTSKDRFSHTPFPNTTYYTLFRDGQNRGEP
jgi:hypothetical protein